MIRDMKATDWERVSDIYKYAIEEGKSTFSVACPSYEQWNNAHLKSCRFVYEVDNVVVGWVAVSLVSPREPLRGAVEESIYIDQNYRGKGIGQILLQKLISECEKNGIWSLYAVIFSTNQTSIALHKKCGFREIGYRERIAKDKFGNWQNTTLMELRF